MTSPLIGRHDEKRRIEALTAAAADGRGGALVLRGEAGIGKSALLDHAVHGAPSFRVVEASGSEFEQELPYSGLHQLCLPMLGHLDDLPAHQRDALRVAFGLAEGAPGELRIGLSALGLMSAAARERPLLCRIDDAQWLDDASARVLRFLARRVATDPIALFFAVRYAEQADEFAELPDVHVGGLADDQARALLAERSPFPLDDQVRDRLVAEARGSPLALLELPRAGGFAPPDGVPTGIEHVYRERLTGLSDEARLLLIVAAADPTGDPGLLWSAAHHLDLDLSRTSAEAAGTGLAAFGPRVGFCHPLARSAVYRAATDGERRTAHRALAAATDPDTAPDRRAWHRAQAGAGPDDQVADELDRCAARAQARGGVAAAAAFLERSVALSLDPERRITRTLAAAQAAFDAGASDNTVTLLNTLDEATLGPPQLAQSDLLRGRAAFARHHDGTGPRLMVRAAERLSGVDPEQSRHSFLDALEMSLVVGRAGGVIGPVVAAARTSAPASTAPDLLDALVVLETHGYPAAAPLLRRAVDDEAEWARRPALATMVAVELFDPDLHTVISDWLVKTGRATGSPLRLRLGLAQKAVEAIVLTGDPAQALAATAEEAAIADATDAAPLLYHRLHLAAQRGRRDEFLELAAAVAAEPDQAGWVTNRHATAATLHNGLADYPAALAAARRATEHDDIFLTGPALPELIEAAVRCDESAVATAALVTLTERTQASGTTTGLGVAAYARGLVTGAEEHYLQAVELLAESRLTPYLGRAHLLYGEWLRRQGRRRDCRQHLRTAHDLLARAGQDGFARRAADELRATGERVRSRSEHPYEKLTMQEVAVARLVGAGATSNEVAGQLYVSKRTVDAHLRSIFRKLGLTSRRQLRDHPDLAV
ncbi:LuxR family transcriptional regulator [Actinoplanes sp. TRM 88003]|uniref:LuxR family transcriptional regulator n=1 Tax=Paractinoplanes aksuensis TaxID=2939490 RepID=A0ABT1DVH1_9ACTN|nr:LuxR family transcriptional regulator [Actinoplanes aksuensis]MCO8273656.1 LuxR family transcriptional regulator [Actinoplanes aksuensis]